MLHETNARHVEGIYQESSHTPTDVVWQRGAGKREWMELWKRITGPNPDRSKWQRVENFSHAKGLNVVWCIRRHLSFCWCGGVDGYSYIYWRKINCQTPVLPIEKCLRLGPKANAFVWYICRFIDICPGSLLLEAIDWAEDADRTRICGARPRVKARWMAVVAATCVIYWINQFGCLLPADTEIFMCTFVRLCVRFLKLMCDGK